MFRVGQKVACVDDGVFNPARGRASDHLTKGCVYTIREICEFPYAPDKIAGLGVRLEEVVRPQDRINPDWSDYPFRMSRFRPAVERKTDISFAHEILRKATKRKPMRVPG